jgi:hypothetical protein
MEYKAEDYIKFIEQKRFDKIGAWGMEIIAKKYRRLEHNKGQNLPLDSVSQQRELLIAFDTMREFDIKHDDIEESIDYFLKHKESYL